MPRQKCPGVFMPFRVFDNMMTWRYNINMLIDYLRKQNISLYSVSKGSNVPYSTLRGLACGLIDVRRCQVGILKKIGDYLNLNLQQVYDIIADGQGCGEVKTPEGVTGTVVIRNKKYYLQSKYGDEYICKANEENAEFVRTMAEWTLEDHKADEELEAWL